VYKFKVPVVPPVRYLGVPVRLVYGIDMVSFRSVSYSLFESTRSSQC